MFFVYYYNNQMIRKFMRERNIQKILANSLVKKQNPSKETKIYGHKVRLLLLYISYKEFLLHLDTSFWENWMWIYIIGEKKKITIILL